MNFFGHCCLAREERTSAEFALGSMLPDFFGMARVRLRALPRGELGEGISHHLEVDDAFHGAPAFLDLVSSTASALEARGVRRGSARAVGHVGTELALDAILARDCDAVAAYREALLVEPRSLDLEDSGRHRLATLLTRLRGHEGPVDASPHALTSRLEAALAHRPRLALEPGALAPVELELERLTVRVRARSSELLSEVRERMSRARSRAGR